MTKPSFKLKLEIDYILVTFTFGRFVQCLSLSMCQARDLADLSSEYKSNKSVGLGTYKAKWNSGYSDTFCIKDILLHRPTIELSYEIALQLSSSLLSTITYYERHLQDAQKRDWSHIDPEVRRYVEILNEHGIETFESCQGGDGHSFLEPIIKFHGDSSEGFRAFAVAKQHGFPINDLRRTWDNIDGELTGPHWELTFWKG